MVQTTAAGAAGSGTKAPRAPRATLQWAVALAGCAAAAFLVSQTLTSAELRRSALWAVLGDWLIVPYVVAGLVARIVLFPVGAMALAPLPGRVGAVAVGFAVYMLLGRNVFLGIIAGLAVLVAVTVWATGGL
jgi:hypothetical protein